MSRRLGGTIEFKMDGEQYLVKGEFTYNLGIPKRETIIGKDGTHGYKEVQQESMCEGSISDHADLDLEKFFKAEAFTSTLKLSNGKTIVFREAWNASEGNVSTEEGEVEIKIVSMGAEEIQ